ncbi:MAG TPA: OB-fold nucleic acid binding domain-containing protein [archaeon]|nr:OB-fold nucleic acid binding domain-containing protein [archaeon]
MQRKNLLLIVSIVSTIVGISLIYFAATRVESAQLAVGEITSEMVGRSVTTTGYVSSRSAHPDGHIFLTLSDEDKNRISVPLFAGFVAELRKNHFNINSIQKGTYLQISGLVDEYKGQLQIVPRKISDIKFLSGD